MAAVLKKRVVAELSQGTQSLSPPRKKFKVSDASIPRPNIPLDLNRCKTNIDVYQALTSLSERFPISMESVGPLVDHLLEYYQLETDFSVKVKILEILQQLLQYPSCNSKLLYHIIKEHLKNEDSNIVINEMLSIMLAIALLNYGDHKLITDIVRFILELLRIRNHVVRSKCLQMLGRIASPDIPYPSCHRYKLGRHTILDDVIIVWTMDSDWRVRLSALEALLTWHHRKLPLGSSLYGHLISLLEDNEEKVRSTVLKLLWVVAQKNPDMMVETKEGGEVVADNCFVKLCEATTDISISVRTHAARLLGNIQEVSMPILFQTLEKKLMSNYRKKVSAHERQREMFMSGEWSAGKVADDAPREKLNPNNVTIVSKGACGAFVNGLEDEFSCVRNASLDSLCGFSCRHLSFLQYSQDFVVDMLTDEIDSVRLNGINSLHKMSKLLSIRDDQLELILGILKDFYSYMREATHRLLSSCTLSTTTGIKMTVTSLLQNLSQYPGDRPSIWRTMKALGNRNSTLVFAVLPSLLGLHQFFDTKENTLDDPSYVALMILASNASPNCPTMTSILPPYIFTHFAQLNNVYPHLIPETRFPHSGITKMCKVPTASLSNQKKFLNTVLSQLDKINFMRDISSAYKLLKIACRDLNKVNELAQDMSATAMFVTLHLRCQIKINEILSENKFTLGSDGSAAVCRQIQKLMRTLTYMKTAFIGVTSAQLVEIQQLSLVASAFQLIYDFPSSSPSCRKSACFVFSDQVAKLNDLLSQTNLPSTRMLSHLNTEFNAPQNSEVMNYHRVLLSALGVHASTVPLLPQVDNQLLMMKATVIEPASNSDFVHTVIPNYILPIKMIVELENVEHIDRIRIYVQYANQRQYFIKPNNLDFQTINRMNHKLVTSVMLSGAMWSEPCQVQISVVYIPPNSLNDLPDYVTSNLAEESKFASSLSEEYIQLSKVITTTIHPSAQRDSLF